MILLKVKVLIINSLLLINKIFKPYQASLAKNFEEKSEALSLIKEVFINELGRKTIPTDENSKVIICRQKKIQ